MKKTKLEKGITLIALIITIIILLILAVVTIGSIKNSNIIAYAQNAASGYNTAKDNEEGAIAGYESLIESNLPGSNGGESGIGKATVGTIVEKNSTIDGEAYSSTNPIIPAGFAAINITGNSASSWTAEDGPEVSKGLVITDNITKDSKDTSGNATIGSEFVWVPVAQINDMIMCQEHGASVTLDEETLQCPTCGENTLLAGKLYAYVNTGFSSNKIEQSYEKNTGTREPDVITGASGNDSTKGTNYDYQYLSTVLDGEYAKEQTVESFKSQLQNEFDNMAKSVAKYGGFYVGRYEMSLTLTKTTQSKYGETSSDASQTDTNMWYGLYTKSKTYLSTKSSVQSTMIWGSQYDAMLRWMANGNDSIVNNSNIENINNTDRKTGNNSSDLLNNIFDLYGNSWEWTLSANESDKRVNRGGNYLFGGSASDCYANGYPTYNMDFFGSRITLYII